MILFFKMRNNEPATLAEMVDELGAAETGISTILYRRNDAEEFEKAGKKQTGKAPARLWRLSAKTFNAPIVDSAEPRLHEE